MYVKWYRGKWRVHSSHSASNTSVQPDHCQEKSSCRSRRELTHMLGISTQFSESTLLREEIMHHVNSNPESHVPPVRCSEGAQSKPSIIFGILSTACAFPES